jgi:dihydroorotase
MPELWDRHEIDTEATEKVIAANPGLVKGVKLRLVGGLVAKSGVEVMKLAKNTAKKFGLPVMVHIGDPDRLVAPEVTREILPIMEEGDILIHIYTSQQGGVLLPDGSLMPEFREAAARGVTFDVGHGRNNFSFAVAERILAQGIKPNLISSDVNAQSIYGPVYGLTVTMSKLLALGLNLNEIIAMTTINPARVLKIHDHKGSLKPGMEADISILEVAPGKWRLVDAEKSAREVTRLIVPRITVKSGQVIPADPVAWPEALI